MCDRLLGSGRGSSSADLDRAMQGVAGYQGAVPVDRLPKTLKPRQSVIVNLQTSAEGGSHWVCAKHLRGLSLYFDPFGGQPDDRVLGLLHRSGGKAYINNAQYQNKDSDRCGAYCVYVLQRIQEPKDIYRVLYEDLRPGWSAGAQKRNEKRVEPVMDALVRGSGLTGADALALGEFALDFVQNPVLATITKGVEVIGDLYNRKKEMEQKKANYARQKRTELKAKQSAWDAQRDQVREQVKTRNPYTGSNNDPTEDPQEIQRRLNTAMPYSTRPR